MAAPVLVTRVLVTGGSGFLGRQIVAALQARGAFVMAPSRHEADLLQADARHTLLAATPAEILIHAAWVTRPGEYWGSAENLAWAEASADLFHRFAAAGGRRVVFVGSCAEYDWETPRQDRWAETRPCRPHTLYGSAKLRAWRTLERLAARTGLAAANARVFTPVGLHEHPQRLLPSLVRAVLARRPVAVGPAALTRDLMDVRDAGAAIAALALADVTGAVNIGSGRPISLGKLAHRVAGPDHTLIRLGARKLPPGEPLRLVADPARLRHELGFVPRHALEQIIADAFAHWGTRSEAPLAA
jgi:nucleoside-diphosphate-sugar epimerase